MDNNHTNQHPPKKSKGYLALLIGVGVFVLLFLIGFLPKVSNDRKIDAQAKENVTAVPEVQVVSPRLATADTLELPGTIQAFDETALQARTQGYVSKLLVDIGTHVTKGQLLAVIQAPDVDQQVYQAQADTAKSQAVVGQSRADLARSKAGVSQSLSELDRQKATIKQAQASYASSVATLDQAKANLTVTEARLDQSKQALETQRANLGQAEAQQKLAKVTSDRYANLLKQGFVAQQDFDQAATAYQTSHESVEAAQANVRAAESDVTASADTIKAAEQQVKSAEAGSDAALSVVKANEESYRSLVSASDEARQTVNDSAASVVANQAGVRSSQANERHYAVMQSFENIVAPFDGVITAKNVEQGALVSPGAISTPSSTNATPNVGLLGIARVDELVIYVNIPQTYYQAAKDGSQIQFHVRELPGRTFVGTLRTASGAIDQTTRTLQVELLIKNDDHVLIPGMYAQAVIPAGDVTKTIRIPADTFAVDSAGTRVVTVDGQNHAHWQKVEIGRDFGTELEVLSGLKPTDKLVANPTDLILENELVKPVVEKQPSASSAPPSQSQPPSAGSKG